MLGANRKTRIVVVDGNDKHIPDYRILQNVSINFRLGYEALKKSFEDHVHTSPQAPTVTAEMIKIRLGDEYREVTPENLPLIQAALFSPEVTNQQAGAVICIRVRNSGRNLNKLVFFNFFFLFFFVDTDCCKRFICATPCRQLRSQHRSGLH
jgi:hypothetical protein